jgi:Na+/H+-translocating membrane pyrophosphatase
VPFNFDASINFFALSHAPPELSKNTAISKPVNVPNIKNEARTSTPKNLSLIFPVVIGLIGRYLGEMNNDRFLGVEVLASFLMFGTLTGLLMAVFLDNSGGAWDNAKKLIEASKLKGTLSHHAAITGDTVGDPFKDTAGPSLHVIITTMSTTALVLAPLFIGNVIETTGQNPVQ